MTDARQSVAALILFQEDRLLVPETLQPVSLTHKVSVAHLAHW